MHVVVLSVHVSLEIVAPSQALLTDGASDFVANYAPPSAGVNPLENGISSRTAHKHEVAGPWADVFAGDA